MDGDQTTPCLLVADVGGTNTRVALSHGVILRPDTIARFQNFKHRSLYDVLRLYIEQQNLRAISGVAVAVAGPVQNGHGELTNLEWSIDAAVLERETGAPRIAVLNDLQAQGYALGLLDSTRLRTVVTGSDNSKPGARLVIGVGTGFNASPVHTTGEHLLVPPSEAGHANLPVTNGEDHDLWQFIDASQGFPAVEDVLSGRGLENVYRWRQHVLAKQGQKTAADIVTDCESGDDPAADEAVAAFVRHLGTVCGNLTLIHLPVGGVYLVGGVARAVAPHLSRYGFAEAFRDKGRFTDFMQSFAVHVVEDDYAALVGLAAFLET